MLISSLLIEKPSRFASTILAGALWLAFTSPQIVSAATPTKGVYVGGEFYPPTTATQDAARKSGFSRLFIFTLGVDSAGTLTAFGDTLCQNGVYVGDPTWGSALAACKAAPSSVDRIEICIGSWGSTAFTNIRNLIASQGTSTGSILYRNFLALKNATDVDAIQFDDEGTYDVNSMVAFGNMLYGMGLKVALTPYTVQNFWVNVKSQLGSKVDTIYLQCYDGGAGNDPVNWTAAFGGFKVTPGLWGNTDSQMSVMTKMRNWSAALDGLPGGFMWLNGTLPGDGFKWAGALRLGLDAPFFIIKNRNTGMTMDLVNGNTADGAAVQTYHLDYNDKAERWAVVPTENGNHFKIMGYLSAKCVDVVGGSTADNALIESRSYYTGHTDQQWDLVDAGSGFYYIKNVKSGKVLTATGTTDFSPIYQLTSTGAHAQQWRLMPQGDYFLKAAHSDKYVSAQGGGSANDTHIVQYSWQDNPWFKWNFVNKSYGWYGVYSVNAPGKVICVNAASTVAGEYLHLWDYNSGNIGDQDVRIRVKLDGTFEFYFRHDGMTWDVGGGSQSNNASVNQYPDTTNLWQQFYMERVHE
jgi:hypothetical protein